MVSVVKNFLVVGLGFWGCGVQFDMVMIVSSSKFEVVEVNVVLVIIVVDVKNCDGDIGCDILRLNCYVEIRL